MSGYARLWLDQFRLRNFLLSYTSCDSFHRSEWGKAVLPFALYRTALFIYVLAIQIYAPLYFNLGAKFLIFNTYWGFLTLTFGLFISALNTWMYYAGKHGRNWDKVQWVFFNLYSSVGLTITVLYWIFVFNGNLTFANFNTHAVNSMIIIIDLFISAVPVRLLHFYQPVIFWVVYLIFTIIYWKAGGLNNEGKPYIYKVSDYNANLGLALGKMLAVTFLAVPLSHLVIFILFTIRVSIRRCFFRDEDTKDETTNQDVEMAN